MCRSRGIGDEMVGVTAARPSPRVSRHSRVVLLMDGGGRWMIRQGFVSVSTKTGASTIF